VNLSRDISDRLRLPEEGPNSALVEAGGKAPVHRDRNEVPLSLRQDPNWGRVPVARREGQGAPSLVGIIQTPKCGLFRKLEA
jgi:hypothetical protein